MFKQSLKEFFQSKTNWTGMTMIATGAYLIYQKDVVTGMQSAFGGLALITVKDAIAKT